jgi:hypothetical protein
MLGTPLPRYAVAFCQMFADYVHEVFSIIRPSEPKANTGL